MTPLVEAAGGRTSLRRLTASGVRWLAVSNATRQAMGFFSTAILARLLAPSDYGLLAMAVIVTGFATIFSDLGTSSAVVQRSTITDRLLSTVFWGNLAIGLLLAAVVVVSSPLAAAYFREPRVRSLLCALAPTFLVSSFSTVQKSICQRELQFRTLALAEIAAAVTGAVVAILAALAGWRVWSLVCQTYALAIVQCILLWLLVYWKPQWAFTWEDLRSVRRYSLHLVGFNVMNYWARTADNTLIGRYLGSNALGFYSMAYRLMQYPIAAVSGLVGRATFPAFSRIQHNDEAFRQAYLKTVGYVSLITLPMMMGLLVLARPLVHGLLSAKWDPIVLPVRIFALVGANQSLATLTGNIYTAKGNTDTMFRVGSFNSALYVLGIIVGLRWGVVGVAICYGIADVIATLVDYHAAFRLVSLRFHMLWRATWRPLLGSIAMAGVIFAVSALRVASTARLPGLLLLVAMGVGIYAVLNWTFNRQQLTELADLAFGQRGASNSAA